jgi:uncharacterized glyoxalase superfamily protein PhnB
MKRTTRTHKLGDVLVGDIISEVARLRDAGLRFRNDIVAGPGGSQILLEDPSGPVVHYRDLDERAPLGLGPHTEGSMFDTGPTVVYISLDEVDSVHDRALAAGAEILMAPTDQDYGSRDFVAKDHEGNVWCFGTYQPGS